LIQNTLPQGMLFTKGVLLAVSFCIRHTRVYATKMFDIIVLNIWRSEFCVHYCKYLVYESYTFFQSYILVVCRAEIAYNRNVHGSLFRESLMFHIRISPVLHAWCFPFDFCFLWMSSLAPTEMCRLITPGSNSCVLLVYIR